MDLTKTCRTCFRTDGTLCSLVVSITPKIHSSTSSSAFDLWKIYTKLLITYDTSLPDQICTECVNKIQQSYVFVTKCEESEWNFRKLNKEQLGVATIDNEYVDISEINTENFSFLQQPIVQKPNGSTDNPLIVNHLLKKRSNICDTKTKTNNNRKSSVEKFQPKKIKLEAADPAAIIENNQIFEVTEISDNIHYTLDVPYNDISTKVKNEPEIDIDESSWILSPPVDYDFPKQRKQKLSVRCPACAYKCAAKEILEKHMVDRHIVGSICRICNKAFQGTPLKHCSEHLHKNQGAAISISNDRRIPKYKLAFPYKCEYCVKPFRSKSGYIYHLQAKHGLADDNEKVVPCNVCPKSFRSNSALESHMRTHSGEKPYICEFCSKTFVQKGHLVVHVRRHTGERPYKCEFCPKRFPDKSNYNKHLMFHTRERPYKCRVCPRAFQRKKSLELHFLCHSGCKRSYKCDLCLKKFQERTIWKQHMRDHKLPNDRIVQLEQIYDAVTVNREFDEQDEEEDNEA